MKIINACKFVKRYGSIYVDGYHWLTHVKNNIKVNPVYSSKWRDDYKNAHLSVYPLDIMKESTYSDCISGEIFTAHDKLYLRIVIYDGEMLCGQRVNIRCEFVFHVKRLSKEILKALNQRSLNIAERQYLEEQESQYRLMIQKRAESLFFG